MAVFKENATQKEKFYYMSEKLQLSRMAPPASVSVNTNRDNIVTGDVLRNIHLKTMETISRALSNTFGPMGSNTKIIKGSDANTITAEYTKDGHKTLKHIILSNPIEMSIQEELENITRHVELEVGDGTTSAVMLAERIYSYIVSIMEEEKGKVLPYEVIYAFKKVVGLIQEEILKYKREVTLDDIYDICMISTNGNEEISRNISNIYNKFGMDVQLDVSISTAKESMIKEYDGVTISEGYSDPAYINNLKDGTAEIHNASIYAFLDPIDTMDMVSLFEKIIINNIIEPINAGEECVPTVIVSPKMTRDMSSLMGNVIDVLNGSAASQKPPLLVLTDISGTDEAIFADIAKLCGCKYIKKYIDKDIKEADAKKGMAATVDNVCDFAGYAELVVSDVSKTKFINPVRMYITNELGEREESEEFKALYNFLSAELNNAYANAEDERTIGKLKKRLHSLKANMVEYLVGGISIEDREADKDLVVDAVKNCASASRDGVGYAANWEGFNASMTVVENILNRTDSKQTLELKLASAIFRSYAEVIEFLYGTVMPPAKVKEAMDASLEAKRPYNLRTLEPDGTVKTSIMTDVKILEAISKIITIMGTSNQCLLQAPQLNTY